MSDLQPEHLDALAEWAQAESMGTQRREQVLEQTLARAEEDRSKRLFGVPMMWIWVGAGVLATTAAALWVVG